MACLSPTQPSPSSPDPPPRLPLAQPVHPGPHPAVIDGLPPTPTEGQRSWPHRLSKFLTACSGSSASQDSWGAESSGGELSPTAAGLEDAAAESDSPTALQPPTSPLARRISPSELGPPDCLLAGSGWDLPVHWAVLRRRCDHFRARCDSGMRDALASRCEVPDHFSRESMEGLVRYAYTDQVDRDQDPQAAVALLHGVCRSWRGRVLGGSAAERHASRARAAVAVEPALGSEKLW